MQDRLYLQEVLAGGELRHHAPVARVDRDLRGDDVREHAPAVFDDRGGGLVAGAFDSEDEHANEATTASWVQADEGMSLPPKSARGPDMPTLEQPFL